MGEGAIQDGTWILGELLAVSYYLSYYLLIKIFNDSLQFCSCCLGTSTMALQPLITVDTARKEAPGPLQGLRQNGMIVCICYCNPPCNPLSNFPSWSS